MDYDIFYKLGLSLLLGAFIGIERQIHHLKLEGERIYYLGLRTFALTSFLGTIAGLIYFQIPILFFLITFALLILILCHYIFDSMSTKDFGITTEITLIFTYIIGVLIATNILSTQIVIGVTVILLVLLSQKERLKSYIKKIEEEELRSFISYAVIALVVLPLLPNISVTISDIPYLLNILQSFGINTHLLGNLELINPFRLWLFVALITGVEVFGYILERVIGKNKGWLVAAFAGGFISSTATTQSLALESIRVKHTNFLVAGAILATMASFLQLSLLILPLNFGLFVKILPIFLSMVGVSFLISLYLLKKEPHLEKFAGHFKRGKLFYLSPAIKFALLFLFIKLTSGIGLIISGHSTFLLLNAIGAIPGLDAVIINISETTKSNIPLSLGLSAIMLAVTVNILVKCLISLFQGAKEFSYKFIISSLLIVLIGFFGLVTQL